jgi:hypothetical protein
MKSLLGIGCLDSGLIKIKLRLASGSVRNGNSRDNGNNIFLMQIPAQQLNIGIVSTGIIGTSSVLNN